MSNINLIMNNRTKLNLIFVYNDIRYEISARRSERVNVESGHKISVYDPNHTKVTRNKRIVEFDYYIYDLTENTVIDCELIGWQLSLQKGVDVV